MISGKKIIFVIIFAAMCACVKAQHSIGPELSSAQILKMTPQQVEDLYERKGKTYREGLEYYLTAIQRRNAAYTRRYPSTRRYINKVHGVMQSWLGDYIDLHIVMTEDSTSWIDASLLCMIQEQKSVLEINRILHSRKERYHRATDRISSAWHEVNGELKTLDKNKDKIPLSQNPMSGSTRYELKIHLSKTIKATRNLSRVSRNSKPAVQAVIADFIHHTENLMIE